MRPDGSIIDTSEGGPVLFIEKALEDAGVPFSVHEGERMTVDIEVHDDGEYGRIPDPLTYRKLGEVSVSRYCLVSTLLDEWEIDTVPSDRLMVDIQGYVRDGSAFGRKQAWPLSEAMTKQIFCLKGTEEEIGYIPEDLLEDQKASRMLVVTHGEQGAVVHFEGREYTIPAQQVDELPDTVGAGDTFFAYYAAALSGGDAPEEAGNYAARKTADFLSRKK